MTTPTALSVKRLAPAGPGEFQARIYLTGGPPDGDGDVILRGAIQDGHRVQVSVKEHSSIFGGAGPAGDAELHHVANAVHAFGRAPDSVAGRALRAKLLETGPAQEWSIGWLTATVKARAPTPEELTRWPDARRVIVQWNPIEISPVDRGACGPTCRTLGAKCAGGCTCGGTAPPPRPADFKEWIPDFCAERAAARVFLAAMKRWGIHERPTLKWFRGPIERCSGQFLDDRAPPEVWIATGMDPIETAIVAGHELYHALERERQLAGKSWGYNDHMAEAFSRRLVQELIDQELIDDGAIA